MTNIIKIDEVKQFVRVEHAEDDAVIEMLVGAAQKMVEARLKRPLVGDDETAVVKDGEELPVGLKWALMGVVAYLYENRDATDDDVRARLLRNIALDPYILWG